MTIRTAIASAFAAGVLLTSGAQAATEHPTFELRVASSLISGEGSVFASAGRAAQGSWTPRMDEAQLFIDDFWNWNTFNVAEPVSLTATVVLDEPASGRTNSIAGTLLADRKVEWDGPAEFVLDDGSLLSLSFSDTISNRGYSDATASYTAASAVPPAPIPLPAAGGLLLAGIGGLGAMRARRKAA